MLIKSFKRDLERSTYLEQKRDSRLQLFTITKRSDINRMFLKTILLNTIGTTTIYLHRFSPLNTDLKFLPENKVQPSFLLSSLAKSLCWMNMVLYAWKFQPIDKKNNFQMH